MDRYVRALSDVFSIFGSAEWVTENIFTIPTGIDPENPGSEYIRVSVIPSGKALNRASLTGILLIDIFTPRNKGPLRTMEIADKLDDYLQNKTVNLLDSASTQFLSSSLGTVTRDRDNATLNMTLYSIPFSYYGVL